MSTSTSTSQQQQSSGLSFVSHITRLLNQTPTFVKASLCVATGLYILKKLLTLPRGRSMMGWSGTVVGHRGARFPRTDGTLHSLYPENTMEAFIYAIDNDADGIEFDIRLIKSGEWVVFHDGYINPLVRFTAPRENTEGNAALMYRSFQSNANLLEMVKQQQQESAAAATLDDDNENDTMVKSVDNSNNVPTKSVTFVGDDEAEALTTKKHSSFSTSNNPASVFTPTHTEDLDDDSKQTLRKIRDLHRISVASLSQSTPKLAAGETEATFPAEPENVEADPPQNHHLDASTTSPMISNKSPSLLAQEMISLNEQKAVISFDDLSLHEIKQLRYIGSDRNVTMPTLEEVIHLCQAKNIQHVYVEIKTYSVNPIRLRELATTYVEFYRKHKAFMDANTVTIAFNPLIIYWIRYLEPDVAVCLLHEKEMFWENGTMLLDAEANGMLKYIPEIFLHIMDQVLWFVNREVFLDLVGCSMYGPCYNYIEEKFMNRLFDKGICAYLWGLKNPSDIDEKLKRAGVCISCDGDYVAFKENFCVH